MTKNSKKNVRFLAVALIFGGATVGGFMSMKKSNASVVGAAGPSSASSGVSTSQTLTVGEEWLKFSHEIEFIKLKDAILAPLLAMMNIIGGMGAEPETYKTKMSAKLMEFGIHVGQVADILKANKSLVISLQARLDAYPALKKQLIMYTQLFGVKQSILSNVDDFLIFFTNIKTLLAKSLDMLAEIYGRQMQEAAKREGVKIPVAIPTQTR